MHCNHDVMTHAPFPVGLGDAVGMEHGADCSNALQVAPEMLKQSV